MLLEEVMGKWAEEHAVVQHHLADQSAMAARSVIQDPNRRVREG